MTATHPRSPPTPPSPPIPPPETDSMTEEDKRTLIADLERYQMEIEEDERLKKLGSLDKPAVLEGMVAARRWLNIASYLQRALSYHAEAAQAAVAYPDGDDPPPPTDMLRAHPELFVLPRRQHVLELLRIGDLEEAQEYFNEDILEPLRFANRTPHLDTLVTKLQDVVFSDEAAAQLNLPEERHRTLRHIQDYQRVYFPTLKTSEVAASMEMPLLHTTWPFGEHISDYNYRCLVCHQLFDFHSAPDNRMVEHLHDGCPAITPAVHHRLPRRNRPTQPPEADDATAVAAADPQQQDDDDE